MGKYGSLKTDANKKLIKCFHKLAKCFQLYYL